MLSGTIAAGGKANAIYGGTGTVDGVPCDKVLIHKSSPYAGTLQEYDETYYIGQADHLVRRCISHVTFDGKNGFTRDSTLKDIQINPSVNQSVYKYTPPPGAKLEQPQKRVPLLANGTRAPEFTAVDSNKKALKLTDFRGKVIVIDFWASWCGPCMQSMPHAQEVIKKLADEGMPVVALAVDDGEPAQMFQAWVTDKKAKYPNLDFVFVDPHKDLSSQQYKVTGIPTQYIVDRKGIIRASFVGYGGPTEDLEKAIRAAAGS